MRRLVPLLTTLVLVVAACGGEDTPIAEPDDAPSEPDEQEDDPVDDQPPEDTPVDEPDSALGIATEAAIRDAAAAADVDPDEVEVVTVEQVTWRSGAVGCPEPDRMYTQALVEGYRIVVRVGGTEVHYHGADDQPPFRCDDPEEPAPEGG